MTTRAENERPPAELIEFFKSEDPKDPIRFMNELQAWYQDEIDGSWLAGWEGFYFPIASFDGATFSGDYIRFENATFAGPAFFKGAKFSGEVQCDGVTFGDHASFEAATFSRFAIFSNARFTEGASFYGATFSDNVVFARATLGTSDSLGKAWFDDAKFLGLAAFSEATFSAPALFTGATFREGRFWKARFSAPADFSKAAFTKASFSEATFSDYATFEGARFSEEAMFQEATFRHLASFNGATFSHAAQFDSATFSGFALFAQARFLRYASFIRATFETDELLGPLLAGHLVIDGATFRGHVIIEAATSRLSAVGTRFQEGTTMRLRRAEIVLEGAAFRAPSSVSFARTFELSGAEEMTDVFDESLLGEDPQPRVVSLRQADAGALTLSNLNLSGCSFDGAHNLDGVRVEGRRSFAQPPGGWRRAFGWIPVWRWTRRQTIAEEHRWRRSREAWSVKREGWDDTILAVPERTLYATGAGPSDLQPNRIAALYRALRKALEDSKNEPGAADFYYGEMEMRRFDSDTPWGERTILFLYWLTAGYGSRGSRSLICLAALVLGVAGVFAHVGFASGHVAFWKISLPYTAQATLSIEDRAMALKPWGNVLLVALRLVGPLFLGLALLSVRNRVKR